MIRKLVVGALAALTLGLAGLGFGARTASAEIVRNDRSVLSAPVYNPCEAGINPIALQGIVHHVWYTTPEGTLKMNIQGRLTGRDTDGAEYILNFQRHMEHLAWPAFEPATDRFTQNLISKGSDVNAQIVMTIDTSAVPPVVTAVACRG